MLKRPGGGVMDDAAVDKRSIAIVGMSCRFPGAPDLSAFWREICAGRDLIEDLPKNRAGLHGYVTQTPGTPGRSISRQGGFLADIDSFDAWLFGISRREAMSMDPQQRLLLELAWLSAEDAGIPIHQLRGSRTGVYVGVCYNDYNDLVIQHPQEFDIYRMTGGFRSMLCGRISHALGLAGPSLSIDAACASSLVAVHLAMQSLRCGETDLALVGAVNLLLHPLMSVGFSQARMLSPESRCRAFAENANGFVRSDGAALVVLKPLWRAIQDEDRIYAVLRGSAVGNDGVGEGPLMTPSVIGQEQVIRAAYTDACVDPASVSYVEAHGTGTPTGDPIEAEALGRVLGPSRQQPLRIGSVKSNIGHTEAAAGMASLVKTALCLYHRTLVSSLHCERPNPRIPWDTLRLAVQRQTEPWPAETGERRSGVSAFGLNGTNAHVVLSECPVSSFQQLPQQQSSGVPSLLLLSAESESALAAMHSSYADLFRMEEKADSSLFAATCLATLHRRAHLRFRRAIVCSDAADAASQLNALLRGEPAALSCQAEVSSTPPPLVFLYSGQGSQWAGMARRLYARFPVFRDALLRCEAEIGVFLGERITAKLLDESAADLVEIALIQPTLFAIQVALTELFCSIGLRPDIVVGHSMGEVAAAYAAGALSLSDASRIICLRSQLLRRKSGQGAMAVVELPLRETEQLLHAEGITSQVSVAVSSSPSSTVIAGEPNAVRRIVELLVKRDIFSRQIQVDVSSHSPQMDDLRAPLLEAIEGIVPKAPSLRMISTVTQQQVVGAELGPSYWVQNLRQPVLLSPVFESLFGAGEHSVIELSPHPLLLSAVQQCQASQHRRIVPLPSMRRQEEESTLLGTLGALHCRGHAIAWEQLVPRPVKMVSLPAYPFQRESCHDPLAPQVLLTSQHLRAASADECLGTPLPLSDLSTLRVWELDATHEVLQHFSHHRVMGEVVVPGAATVAWALTAMERSGLGAWTVEDVSFSQVLFLSATQPVCVQLLLRQERSDEWRLRVSSATADRALPKQWTLNAQVTLRPARTASISQFIDVAGIRRGLALDIESRELYARLERLGLQYGPSYQQLARAVVGQGDALGFLTTEALTDLQKSKWAKGLSPSLLDACLQLLVVASDNVSAAFGTGFLPVSIDALRVRGDLRKASMIYARMQSLDAQSAHPERAFRLAGDIWLLSESGEILLEVVGAKAQPLQQPAESSAPLWHMRWRPASVTTELRRSVRPRPCLIIGSSGKATRAIQDQIERTGRHCIVVSSGDAFAILGPAHCELRFDSSSDWRKLATLFPHGQEPGSVIFLRGLDEDAAGRSVDDLRLASRSCLDLLHWVQLQGLTLQNALDDGGLLVLTRRARAVLPAETTLPAQALLWGISGVLANESSALHVRRIDVDESQDDASLARLLIDERAVPYASTVAYRLGKRYVAELCPSLPMGAPAFPPQRVRADATYVVTGGLSGIGLRTAQWLAAQGASRLLLLGRRGVQDENREGIAELQRQGVTAIAEAVDITDGSALAAVLQKNHQSARPVRGVVHAAAVLDDGTLASLDDAQLLHVLAPKVLGAMQLAQHIAPNELDFFVAFSSLAAVLGNPGQGAYCAANSFLDSLMESWAAEGRAALSIAWGPWTEIGLAARTGQGQRLAAIGLPSLRAQEGMAAFARLFSSGSTCNCPIVGAIDRVRWQEAMPTRAVWMGQSEDSASSSRAMGITDATPTSPVIEKSRTNLRDTVLAATESDRRERTLAGLREMLTKILRTAPAQKNQLREDIPLAKLGLDSLMAVELRNRVDTELGVRVPLSVVMQSGTLATVATHVLAELADSQLVGPKEVEWDEGEL